MNQLRKFRKNKDNNTKTVRKIKSTTLKICLILINLIFTTFAWFAYTRVLELTFDVNVSAWQVDFKNNEETLGNSIQFQAEHFYPGMEDYYKEIEISNLGDKDASISYEIEELKILGTEYQVKDTPSDRDSEYTVYKAESTEDGITTIKLLNDETKYPFEIFITYTPIIYSPLSESTNGNTGSFEIRAKWDYTLTDEEDEEKIKQRNELDTQWGYDVANFYNSLPEGEQGHALEVTLKVNAKQIIN